MPMISIGTSLTDVDTTARYKIGAQFLESVDDKTSPTSANGERLWTYTKNGDVTAFAIGNPILRKASTTTKEGIQSTAAAHSAWRVIGVAQHAIAVGSYGWVLTKGWGSVLNDSAGTLSANQALTVSAAVAGSVKASTVGTHEPIGFVTTDIAASTLGSAYIACPA